MWITADESRSTVWYHSHCTIGLKPKPIYTGFTLHTLCVTYGGLALYKLFARCYGGVPDNNLLDYWQANCSSDQKWINLYDLMLTQFKGKGYCVTCDSVCMGDTIG